MIFDILTRRRLFGLCLACALAAPVFAQKLARPGWAGSGITTDLWWKHAIFYEVDPARFNPEAAARPLHSVPRQLDYLRALGIDAILLTPIQPGPAHATAINPALGTLDDFDDLLREASRRGLRVLLDLDPAIPPADLASVARFWLNRGIAGFHLTGSGDTAHAQAAALRNLANAYPGRRILIADADASLSSDPRQRTYKAPNTQSAQLVLHAELASDAKLSASSIRPVLAAMQDTFDAGRSLPLLATDRAGVPRSYTRYADGEHDLAIAKVLATILLAGHAEPLLYYGQELGLRTPEADPPIDWGAPASAAKAAKPAPEAMLKVDAPAAPNAALEAADPNSLLNWYRQLIALHHSNATIASGSGITIDQDEKNFLVWVRKPQSHNPLDPPLVIVCNLTAEPLTLSLQADLARLHLRGSFLRTVLRSDSGMGTMHLDAMTISPYTAYIGQLRY